MRTTTFILLFLGFAFRMQAQYFGKKNICIQQGVINFHSKTLNNSINSNKRLSWVTEIEKSLPLSKISSFNLGLGLGSIRNLSDAFGPYENSNFFRTKFGLIFHLPSQITAQNWSPRNFSPLFKVAYNLDIMDKKFENVYATRLSSSLKLGFGAVLKLSHEIGFIYEFSHNQYISEDYRSYFQNNFGLIINLDEAHKAY